MPRHRARFSRGARRVVVYLGKVGREGGVFTVIFARFMVFRGRSFDVIPCGVVVRSSFYNRGGPGSILAVCSFFFTIFFSQWLFSRTLGEIITMYLCSINFFSSAEVGCDLHTVITRISFTLDYIFCMRCQQMAILYILLCTCIWSSTDKNIWMLNSYMCVTHYIQHHWGFRQFCLCKSISSNAQPWISLFLYF